MKLFNEEKKAVIAMSGGVDSSTAAALLLRDGYDLVGITMRLFDGENVERKGHTCCSLDDVNDARAVAGRLGFPYYVVNFTGDFKREVIDRFVSAYQSGATPNPCIDCNRYLKWGRLFRTAEELEHPIVATGHYARIRKDGDRYLLLRAADPRKDQSYVLYSMTQEELSHTLFPLGELSKETTREIAREYGLLNADKHDSQDICFVPDHDYAGFIERYTGTPSAPGDFLSTDGTVLGRHKGIIHYTLGQRKGLGIPSDSPLYVCGIDPKAGTVTLGHEDALFSSTAFVEEVNMIVADLPDGARVQAKVRYRQPPEWATVYHTETGLRLEFDHPQRAITPGQAAVLYDGEYVLAGGRLVSVNRD